MSSLTRYSGFRLRKDGTFWLNLGDSSAGSGSPGGDFRDGKGGDIYLRPDNRHGTGLKSKDQCLIPHRIVLALQGFAVIYADELWKLVDALHRAREENDWDAVIWVEEVLRRWALATKLANSSGWWVRSTIIWQKANCLPSSATDRPTTNFEYVFLLSKSPRYYYDADAIKEPQKEISLKRAFSTNHLEIRKDYGQNTYALSSQAQAKTLAKLRHAIETGGDTRRNKRCIWTIPTRAFKEDHFATFPPNLVKPMILAGTSHAVCSKCGAPWKRVKEQNGEDSYGGLRKRADAPGAEVSPTSVFRTGKIAKYETLGWQPTCDCNADTVKAIVLDPFMGAGTVAVVATELGRDFVGIELGEKYIEMAKRRLAGVTLPLALGEM